MTTIPQLRKRIEDFEGGPGEVHDIVVHIKEIPPIQDEVIIWHMKGEKFLGQEVLSEDGLGGRWEGNIS